MFNFLADFLRFLAAVVLGQKDAARAFIESLDMADRYIRWGVERGDLRDFESAFRELDGCRDEAASSVDLIRRKYRVYARATDGFADLRIKMFRARIEDALAALRELQGELRFVTLQVEASQARLDDLRRQNSLYSAKEEERVLSELQAQQAGLEQRVAEDESAGVVNANFEELVSDVEALCQRAEGLVANLEVHHLLDGTLAEEIRGQLWKETGAVRDKVQAAVPMASE